MEGGESCGEELMVGVFALMDTSHENRHGHQEVGSMEDALEGREGERIRNTLG